MGLFDTPHLGPGPSAEARIAGLRVLIEATGCTDLRVEAVPAEPAEPGEGELRVTALGHLDGVQARVRASWSLPCLDAEAYWTPQSREQPWIPPDWLPPRTTSLTRDAPVGCLLGPDDRNILCYALAETTRPVQIRAGVSEETGEFRFRVEHDLRGDEPLRLLLDTAPRHFADSLARVAAWWSRQDRHRSPAVPDAARRPVYSTWYSHHQRVSAAEVARCTRLAAELGCGAVIVDDGWQTDDTSRGYATAGDWEMDPKSFPDPAGHIAEVRAHGTAYLLWYALPFLGRRSRAWKQFADRVLRHDEELGAAVLDPREPEVRAHLVDCCARAVEEWGADGLKLDFLDSFFTPAPPPAGPGADCAEVHEGVRLLLDELLQRLRREREGVLVEFRQQYISPALWPYATMLRAADCPLSPAEHRRRIADLRLVSGPVPVHSDMLTWHQDETPQRVAAQLIAVLFAVPQLSVDPARLTPEQRETVAFWLRTGERHAEVLRSGTFRPAHPQLGFPLIVAQSPAVGFAAVYARIAVPFPVADGRELLVANASAHPSVLVEVTGAIGEVRVEVFDCRGRVVAGPAALRLRNGVQPVPVPVGGLLRIARLP